MLHRKNIISSPLDLIKESLWNLVLYFIYFFTLLFWIRFIGVSAQGNRGVIINNQKFDDSSGVQYAKSPQLQTIKPPTEKPAFTFIYKPTVKPTFRPIFRSTTTTTTTTQVRIFLFKNR